MSCDGGGSSQPFRLRNSFAISRRAAGRSRVMWLCQGLFRFLLAFRSRTPGPSSLKITPAFSSSTTRRHGVRGAGTTRRYPLSAARGLGRTAPPPSAGRLNADRRGPRRTACRGKWCPAGAAPPRSFTGRSFRGAANLRRRAWSRLLITTSR
jgi:hypothetical protein